MALGRIYVKIVTRNMIGKFCPATTI